ncbi:MAG: hypothetical protein HY040_16260 [Planctomycetes bacterium]|nr:hypothetical protein [Planctomycetota bacterium]
MKLSNVILLAALPLAFAAAAPAQEKVNPTASEKAARRLAELLVPGAGTSTHFLKELKTNQQTWWIEHPQTPLPVFQGAPPRLVLPPKPTTAPPHPSEGMPLAQIRSEPAPPAAVALPTDPLIRIQSVDVTQPLPLPILARPERDRGSLADPTYDTSLALALARVEAMRLAPVPFAPVNRPDPFEHSQAVRLRYIPDEDPQPVVVIPRPPK